MIRLELNNLKQPAVIFTVFLLSFRILSNSANYSSTVFLISESNPFNYLFSYYCKNKLSSIADPNYISLSKLLEFLSITGFQFLMSDFYLINKSVLFIFFKASWYVLKFVYVFNDSN